jgi:hypothetical protein
MTNKNIKMGKISLPLDVRSSSDIPAFEKMLGNGPMAIVLVYADWCGHCNTYKKNVWNPLKSVKGKTMNMASVHYDQLENTSISNAKLEGYPSVLVVGKDKVPATFKNESGKSNAMPNSNELPTMKRLITSNIPSSSKKNSNLPSLSKKNSNLPDIVVPEEQDTLMSSNTTPSNSMPSNTAPSNTMPSNTNVKQNNSTRIVANNTSSSNTALEATNINSVANSSAENSSAVNSSAENSSVANSSAENSTSASNLTPPNLNEDMYNNMEKMSSINSSTLKTEGVNISKNNTQGTTPLLRGGKLFKKLTLRKHRRSSRKSKSKRKN